MSSDSGQSFRLLSEPINMKLSKHDLHDPEDIEDSLSTSIDDVYAERDLDNIDPDLDNVDLNLDNVDPNLDNVDPNLDNVDPNLDNVDPLLDRSSKNVDGKQNVGGLSSKLSDEGDSKQVFRDALSKLSDDGHAEQDLGDHVKKNVGDLLSNSSDEVDPEQDLGDHVKKNVGGLLSNSSDEVDPEQDLGDHVKKNVGGLLGNSSDEGDTEQDFQDILSNSSDDGHVELDFDDLTNSSSNDEHDSSSDDEHVKQASDSSHTEEIPIVTQPQWQKEIYENIEQILKDISFGLNHIPLGLLRYEHLSQWKFDNPSRDALAEPELLLQQEDRSEEERANRIMDWLDERFPQIRMREHFVSTDETETSDQEPNNTNISEGTNPRWFYTEADFNQWLVEEDRQGQGSHPRGSFVKKGGNWRCQMCTYQGLQVWFDRMIAFCPLCRTSNDPNTADEVTWYEGVFDN